MSSVTGVSCYAVFTVGHMSSSLFLSLLSMELILTKSELDIMFLVKYPESFLNEFSCFRDYSQCRIYIGSNRETEKVLVNSGKKRENDSI